MRVLRIVWGALTGFVLAGSASAAIDMNQIDPIGRSLVSTPGFNYCQIFPDFEAFSSTIIDDVDVTGTRVTKVAVAFDVSRPDLPLSAITGWRVSLWDSVAAAELSGNDLSQGAVRTTLVFPSQVQIVELTGTLANGRAYLATIPVDFSILPGRYWLGIAPVLPFTNAGQTYLLEHVDPEKVGALPANSVGINPGQGFGLGTKIAVNGNAAYLLEIDGGGNNGFIATIVPDDYLVSLGRRVSGDLQSLRGIDDDALVLAKFFVPNTFAPDIRLDLSGRSPTAAFGRILVKTRAKSPLAGPIQARVSLKDQFSRLYVELGTIEIGTDYSSGQVERVERTGRFVSDQGGMNVRIELSSFRPVALALWQVHFDSVRWDTYEF